MPSWGIVSRLCWGLNCLAAILNSRLWITSIGPLGSPPACYRVIRPLRARSVLGVSPRIVPGNGGCPRKCPTGCFWGPSGRGLGVAKSVPRVSPELDTPEPGARRASETPRPDTRPDTPHFRGHSRSRTAKGGRQGGRRQFERGSCFCSGLATFAQSLINIEQAGFCTFSWQLNTSAKEPTQDFAQWVGQLLINA